jgi:glycosyltransferase involved in cell wall biosynthesis
VDAASGEAIAGAIERLRSDEALRAALGRRGRDQARPYTWDRTAGDVWRVLEEAAGDA